MNARNDNSPRRRMIWRVLDWIDYIIAGALVLAVLLICGVTLWLTPDRLSQLVDKEASRQLNADVKTGNISFTFWSTFPHFCIVADSLNIRSRALDSIPAEVRAKLPADPDFLISTGRLEGGINIARLLRGQIWLRNVSVGSMKLNLVAVNDSLNNYTLVPSTGKSKIPYFNIDRLKFVDGGEVKYYSLISNTDAKIKLTDASLMPRAGKNNYHLMFKGNLSATSSGFALLRNFPFELDGDVQMRFKPFGISTNNYTVNFGQVKGEVGMDMNLGENMCLNNFDYSLRDFTIEDLRMFLPDVDRAMLKKFDANLQMQASARLTSPYSFSSGQFPSVEVDFLVPGGEVGYTFSDNKRYAVNDVGIAGRLVFDGAHPETSYLEVNNLHLNGLGADINATARVTNLTTRPRIEVDLQGKGDLSEASRRVDVLRQMGLAGAADFKISSSFNLDGSNLTSTRFSADVKADKIAMKSNGYDVDISGVHASTAEKYPDALTMDASVVKLPFGLSVTVDKATVKDVKEGRSYSATGLKADASLGKSKGNARNIGVNLSGSAMQISDKTGSMTFDITGVTANATINGGARTKKINLSGSELQVKDNANSMSYNVSGLKADAVLDDNGRSNLVNLSGQKVNLVSADNTLSCDITGLKGQAVLLRAPSGSGYDLGKISLQGDNVGFSDRRHEASYKINAMKADANIGSSVKGGYGRNIDLNLSGGKVGINTPGLTADLANVALGFNAVRLNKPIAVVPFEAPALWYADNESMREVSHSDEFVKVDLPINVRNLMARWKVALNLKTSGGNVDIDHYMLNLTDVDLKATLDSLIIHNAGIAHGATKGDLKANVTNIRQFLNSPVPAPLYVKADVNLDTVQINQLARDFTDSHPNSAISRGDEAEMGAGIDTVAIILPRNIYADVHATAMQTRYTNLHLYDLMTDIHMADGKASIDTLHISSDFGQLGANLTYDTSNLQNINVSTGIRFYDVDVVSFFNNFQKLAAMWPQMRNLSGTLSIGLDAKAHVFPSMFVNAPSLWADAHIDGVGLQLHQNDFIRHLAHMLLIFQEGPIAIEDISFHAVMHGNLLEVFPTTFEVSKYKLFLMGLNNFNGDLYYHVGVENWPLKIPFGVNIRGNYHHPIMKFGGKDWHDKNGAMITGGVQDTNSFNLVHKVRHYSGEFIHSAANYEE